MTPVVTARTRTEGNCMNDEIRGVLATHARLAAPVESLGDDTDLYEAGMTSHASVTVMLALEDTFDIEFPERLLRKATFSSVGAIRAAVEGLTTAPAE
ncbi:MAG: Aminoacyl carrier protein [Frankiales bacterium]|nr:Aminoacyl carrier protein [Frankiales bacterium]